MASVEELRQKLPDAAKDIKLNIQNVLRGDRISEAQAWGCALCSAYFLEAHDVAKALHDQGPEHGLTEELIDDAKAAAAIMAMNTIYYRFRHMTGNDRYSQLAPGLRMNRMQQKKTDAATFELMAMSCAVLEGCQVCIAAHDKSLKKEGLSEEQIHEAVRIAAAVKAFVVALSLG